MDPELRESMRIYYDERAPEYDDLYTEGAVPGTSIDRDVRLQEVEALCQIAKSSLRGSILDAPCGAGFWMMSYAANCDSITLIDQAPKMLAESRKKVSQLGIADRVETVQADLLSFELPEDRFDSVLIGFLLSHLTDDETDLFMAGIRRACRARATVVVFDSVWSKARQANGSKSGRHLRRLKDGREFDIYKRYFAPEDLIDYRRRFGIDLDVVYEGEAYIAAAGSVVSAGSNPDAETPLTSRATPVLIRGAVPGETSLLTALAIASKASWGYDDAFMAACREELTVSPDDLALAAFVAEVDGQVAGFCAIGRVSAEEAELEYLFVDPAVMRRGIGRALVRRACQAASDMGYTRMTIVGDPNAEAFYLAMGAVRVGETPSVSIPGRSLPLFHLPVSSVR